MACRFSELVVDSRDPESLAAFWAEVLGYEVLGREEDGGGEIGPAAGFGGPVPTIVLAPVAEPTPGEVRLHVDVGPTDRDQDAELARLLALGPPVRTSAGPATRAAPCWPTRRATSSASCAPPRPTVTES